MKYQAIFLFLVANFTLWSSSPPAGFVPLFNGMNLDGWWGAKTEDPDKWMALPAGEFQKKWEASQVDIRQHWSVENGELVNDGRLHLLPRKTLGFQRCRHKTVAGADSGIYLRGVPQIQIWDYQRRWEMENWCR